MPITGGENIGTVLQTPEAAPVDTYVRPAEDPSAGAGLLDLANGLKGVSSELQAYFDEKKAKQDAEDARLGEAEFHRNNQLGYAEAITRGLIPPQASRAWVQGYKNIQGVVAGQDIQNKFQQAYDAWDGKENADPQAYNQFVSSFLRTNIGTHDPDILRGLLPKVRELSTNGMAQHTADVAMYLKNAKADAGVAVANQQMDDARTQGLVSGKGVDYEQLYKNLEATRDQLIKDGGLAEQAIDQKLTDAIAAKAIEKQDPRYLGFLDRKVPGKDYTYAQTAYAQDVKQRTIDHLDGINRRNQTQAAAQEKRENDKAYEDASRKVIDSILQNPSAPIPEDLLAAGAKTDGSFKVKALGWQKDILANKGQSDPEAMVDLTNQILNGGGMRVIADAMQQGTIRNATDLRQLRELVDKYDTSKDAMDAVMKSGNAVNVLATIKQRTLTDDDMSAFFEPSGLSDQGLRLTTAYRGALLDWARANPNADIIAREKAAAEIGATILGRLETVPMQGVVLKPGTPATPMDTLPKSGDSGKGPARPAETLRRPAAPTSPAAPLEKPAQPAPASQQQPQQRGDIEEAKVWFASLPPEKRSEAADVAVKTGRPLTDIIQAAFARQPKAPAPVAPPGGYLATTAAGKTIAIDADGKVVAQLGAPAAPELDKKADDLIEQALTPADDGTEPAPEVVDRVSKAFSAVLSDKAVPTTAATYALSTIKDDPQANRILDFISGPESKGNYNAYFGHGNSKVDLSKNTFGQILAQMKARTDAGSPSSATGRYQFMRKTLQGLMKRMGISQDEKFTPEMQDKMALQLMKDRGYDRYKAGKMGLETFANNLAMEWASLPNFQTGRSHYAGDGLNKSLVTPGQVEQAITGVKPRGN